MNEQELNQFKDIYKKTKLTENEIEESWQVVSNLLPEQDTVLVQTQFNYRLITAGVLLFALIGAIGTVVIAQVSVPGDTLYSVRKLSDRIFFRILGKPEVKLEERVEDIIEVNKVPTQKPEKVADEYKKTLNEAEEEVKGERTEKKEEFDKSLQSREEHIRQIRPSNPNGKENLRNDNEEAVKSQKDVRQEPSSQPHENSNSETPSKQKNK